MALHTKAYQIFLDQIIERDLYDTGVPVQCQEKVVTLSTCTGFKDQRLVVHGKLIESCELNNEKE